MTDTSGASLRRRFLEFFERHDHTMVKSSPLVPMGDPTLMFVNAGMVQFKDVFVGAETRPYSRATTSQKCIRVSGKHNDLGEVGRTARHHTFFEMLGNFSFGDYFKEEAITFAWHFITDEVGLDPSRLWVTVFGGEGSVQADDEARALWRRIAGVKDGRILSLGMKDNFWAMGDTGPCGPCSELHYDTQPDAGEPTLDDFESGRIIEIWNLVFMQFDRQSSGELVALPAPSVDTGMGLERLACVVQGETSNYHTDLFRHLIDAVASAVGKPYTASAGADDVSMRVIADHARATSFLVADGIQPSNDGRGYVLRRIMRRAIRHGKRLGFDDLFFDRTCDAVVEYMGDVYPELREARSLIAKVAALEEEGFRRTLDSGLRILAGEILKAKEADSRELRGEVVFKLYDTYGFPRDLTEVLAEEQGLSVDDEGFARHMEAQKKKSSASVVGSQAVDRVYKQLAQRLGAVTFVGYAHEDVPVASRAGRWRLQRSDEGREFLECACKVRALLCDGNEVAVAREGDVEVVLDPTPFYGEAGGQVGDRGRLVSDDGLVAEVLTTLRPVEGLTVCRARIERGELRASASVWAGYVPDVRKATRVHHSATHLLHGALRSVVGDHVKQAGSLVDPEHLRFDYSHFEPLTAVQRASIESHVGECVARDVPVVTEEMAFDAAKQKGAIALFGEKYGDVVRVVTMGDSVELCGGTHARRTGDLGLVLISREEGVASGVRRLEALVGPAAERRTRETHALVRRAAEIVAGQYDTVDDTQPVLMAVAKAARQYRELCKQVEAAGKKPERTDTAVTVAEVPAVLSLAGAQRVRDLWEGISQLASARGAAAEAVVEAREGTDEGGLMRALSQIVSANRQNERALSQTQRSNLSSQAAALLAAAKEVSGVRILAARLDEGVDAKALRELADDLRGRLGSGVLCLGSVSGGKVGLLVAVTKDLTGRFKAGNLIRELAPIIGGRGGGKPELAQAGGGKPEALEQVFERLAELIAAA